MLILSHKQFAIVILKTLDLFILLVLIFTKSTFALFLLIPWGKKFHPFEFYYKQINTADFAQNRQ